MWRRFRSSPSMVVAVVSLVVAPLCVLYVMERPGTIAIGSPNPYGEIRVIDAHGYRAMNLGAYYWEGGECRASKMWDHVKVTVPEGKQWMVIVGPAPWVPSWGSCPNLDSTYGYYFEYTYEYEGQEHRARTGYLGSGTYDEVDLYIYGSWLHGNQWYVAGHIYLVIEVDEYYEISS